MDGIDVKKPMHRELSKASTMVMEFGSSTVPVGPGNRHDQDLQ